jgi:hypothetical protein
MPNERQMSRMNALRNLLMITSQLVLIFTLQGCIAGTQLIPKSADPAGLKGTYTLLLYGCRYPDDIENMAILVDEAGPYPVELYAPDFMYKVKRGIPAAQALAEAEAFITCGFHKTWQSRFRKISDATGGTIGYELKPLYVPWEIGIPEVLLSSYSLKNGKVTVYIELDPLLKRRNEGGSGNNSSDMN